MIRRVVCCSTTSDNWISDSRNRYRIFFIFVPETFAFDLTMMWNFQEARFLNNQGTSRDADLFDFLRDSSWD